MITPSWELADGSVRYPWPVAAEHRGPAIRVVADDPVWLAALRRSVERWREEHGAPLALIRFEDIAALGNAATGPQLMDVVLATRETLSKVAAWVAKRHGASWTVPILCRHSLMEPNERMAAVRLLLEAGSCDVIPTLAELSRLETIVSHLNSRRPQVDLLTELPMPCWGPAWQHRP